MFYGIINEEVDPLVFVNEAYFGKTPILLEIEKAIHELRKPENLNKYKDLNASKPVQRINRLFEQQFGMDIFTLKVVPEDIINTYTVPVARRYDVALGIDFRKMVVATQATGYRFCPNNNLCIECYVYLGLLKMLNLTDAEVLAIMLHELGHNFSAAVNDSIRLDNQQLATSVYKYWFVIVIMCVFQGKFKEASSVLKYKKNTNKKVSKQANSEKNIYNPLRGLIKGSKGSITDFKSFVKEVFNRKYKAPKRLKQWNQYIKTQKAANDKKEMRSSIGRQDEVIADKFCGIYGYGHEQGSSLMKMSAEKTKAEKYLDRTQKGRDINRKINNTYRNVNDYDEHPYDIQRINEEIKVLEYELKRGCDPKYEAMIKDQIQQLKDLTKTAITVTKDFDKDQKAQAMFNAYINNKEPDAVDQEIEDSINDALEAIVDRSEEN